MAPLKNRWNKKLVNKSPLKKDQFEFPVGSLVWGRLGTSPWWPGIMVEGRKCGISDIPSGHLCVFWFGDSRVSVTKSKWLADFKDHYRKRFRRSVKTKTYVSGVIQAIKVCADRLGHNAEQWTDEAALGWANAGFQRNGVLVLEGAKPISVPNVVHAELRAMKKCNQGEKQSNKHVEHDQQDTVTSPTGVLSSDDLKKVKDGEMDIEKICLGCVSSDVEIVGQHPYFEGSMCEMCLEKFKEGLFEFGSDGVHIYCAVCGSAGQVFVCGKSECSKVYCHHCIELLAADGAKKWILEKEPWMCFLCDEALPTVRGLIQPRPDWKNREKVSALFAVNKVASLRPPPPSRPKSGLRVLSLFDGISTGMVALKMLGMKVEKYYASEVDKDAINVSRLNHPGMIQHIGAIETLNEQNISALGPIDLLLGGSPCADLSLANPARKGLYDTSGTGCLFFEFYRVLKTLQMTHKNYVYWMFENTAATPLSIKNDITRFMGTDPVLLDASWFSAQHRARLFWGNVPGMGTTLIPEVSIKLQDCLLHSLNRKAMVEKIRTVTTQSNSLRQGKNMILPVEMNGNADTLWMTELETIFGLPIHYTDAGNISIGKRQQLLGRAWSVHVIKHILQPLQLYFKINWKWTAANVWQTRLKWVRAVQGVFQDCSILEDVTDRLSKMSVNDQ